LSSSSSSVVSVVVVPVICYIYIYILLSSRDNKIFWLVLRRQAKIKGCIRGNNGFALELVCGNPRKVRVFNLFSHVFMKMISDIQYNSVLFDSLARGFSVFFNFKIVLYFIPSF
jgi:hypothetical protein